MTQYIIRSGAGYLLELKHDTPHLHTDPLRAARFEKEEAQAVLKQLIDLGYEAELVQLRIAPR